MSNSRKLDTKLWLESKKETRAEQVILNQGCGVFLLVYGFTGTSAVHVDRDPKQIRLERSKVSVESAARIGKVPFRLHQLSRNSTADSQLKTVLGFERT